MNNKILLCCVSLIITPAQASQPYDREYVGQLCTASGLALLCVTAYLANKYEIFKPKVDLFGHTLKPNQGQQRQKVQRKA